MELINKQTAIDTILGQPPELHYPAWYAEQIRALTPECKPMYADVSDMISRQQAIDAINEIIRMEHSLRPKVYVAKDAIKKLPSVQSIFDAMDTQYNLPIGTDLISRQAAIDALRDYLIDKRCPDDGTLTCRLIENEVINKLPPAQPEIIYCKDCKHRDPEDKKCDCGMQ